MPVNFCQMVLYIKLELTLCHAERNGYIDRKTQAFISLIWHTRAQIRNPITIYVFLFAAWQNDFTLSSVYVYALFSSTYIIFSINNKIRYRRIYIECAARIWVCVFVPFEFVPFSPVN